MRDNTIKFPESQLRSRLCRLDTLIKNSQNMMKYNKK